MVVRDGSCRSYGLICVSASDQLAIINTSPSYIYQDIYFGGKSKSGFKKMTHQQAADLVIGSFPGGTCEGMYTLPRGHCDPIDGGNMVTTKIREFIEETRLYHDDFFSPEKRDRLRDYCITEDWVGLNNVRYTANYSVFVVDKLSELRTTQNVNQTLKSIFPRLRRKNKYFKRHSFTQRFDAIKRVSEISIRQLPDLLNGSKSKSLIPFDNQCIYEAIKKYTHDRYIKCRN